MKAYLADIIPKIQRFSQKLDNLTLLCNQHWVVIDEITNSKVVYIFRNGGQLLISQNGKVEKARWEYLGNNSLLIDRKDESYLFRHGFLDQNILALKVDGKEGYAFLVNENKIDVELNSIERIVDFLTQMYIPSQIIQGIQETSDITLIEEEPIDATPIYPITFETDKGAVTIQRKDPNVNLADGDKALLDGIPAPTGKYYFGIMWFVHIENGIVVGASMF